MPSNLPPRKVSEKHFSSQILLRCDSDNVTLPTSWSPSLRKPDFRPLLQPWEPQSSMGPVRSLWEAAIITSLILGPAQQLGQSSCQRSRSDKWGSPCTRGLVMRDRPLLLLHLTPSPAQVTEGPQACRTGKLQSQGKQLLIGKVKGTKSQKAQMTCRGWPGRPQSTAVSRETLENMWRQGKWNKTLLFIWPLRQQLLLIQSLTPRRKSPAASATNTS